MVDCRQNTKQIRLPMLSPHDIRIIVPTLSCPNPAAFFMSKSKVDGWSKIGTSICLSKNSSQPQTSVSYSKTQRQNSTRVRLPATPTTATSMGLCTPISVSLRIGFACLSDIRKRPRRDPCQPSPSFQGLVGVTHFGEQYDRPHIIRIIQSFL